jgi:hypothetical protein
MPQSKSRRAVATLAGSPQASLGKRFQAKAAFFSKKYVISRGRIRIWPIYKLPGFTEYLS